MQWPFADTALWVARGFGYAGPDMRRALYGYLALVAVGAGACHEGEPFVLQGEDQACESACGSSGDTRDVALGVGYACALRSNGSLKCWGNNEYGVLGPGVADVQGDASKAGHLDWGDAGRVVQFSAGWHHACALFDSQRARCWGRNDDGQLGLGTTDNYGDDDGETLALLKDVPLEGIASISAGVHSTCAIVGPAIEAPGRVHCWGRDQSGSLGDKRAGDFGDDEPIDGSRPVELPADAVSVAVGADVACALLVGGAVHCWGDNWAGTLGIGLECNLGDELPCVGGLGSKADIPVSGLENRSLVRLALNQTSACVLDNSGALLCWGRNSQSRLGYPEGIVGSTLGEPPGEVNLGNDVVLTRLAVGVRHSCVLDTGGRVRCFGERGPALGYGMESQPGAAGIGGIQSPAEAYALRDDSGIVDLGDFDEDKGPDRAVRIAAGANTTCALMINGDLRCWGENTSGELGYGDPTLVQAIGERGSPADDYGRLGRPDVLTD